MPKRIEFTQEQLDRMKELYESGMDCPEIGRVFNANPWTIRRRLHKMGTQLRHAYKFTQDELSRMAELYESGLGTPRIGKQFGVSSNVILIHLRRMGVEIRPPGGSHGNVIEFTQDELDRMKELYESGLGLRDLGDMFDVSQWTVDRRLRQMGVGIRPRCTLADANEHFFDDLGSELPAYYLGLLFADGCVNAKQGGQKRLSLPQSTNSAELVYQFAQDIEYEGNVLDYIDKHAFVDVKITSDYLCDRLIDLGMTPRKSLTLQFPTEVPQETMRHFLRGFTDGDGDLGFYKDYPWIGVTSGSRPFLLGYKKAMLDLLPHINDNKIIKVKNSKAHRVKWTAKSDCADIARLLYGNCSMALSYKLEIAFQMIYR